MSREIFFWRQVAQTGKSVMRRWWLAVALLLGASEARAETGVLALEGAPQGVIELSLAKGGHEGGVTVKNLTSRTLRVQGKLLDSDGDPRLPKGLSLSFDGKSDLTTLGPNEARRAVIRWTPSSGRAREVYGHVEFVAEGSRERAGVHGELSGVPLLSRHALGLLVLLPLLGALGALGARRAGRAPLAPRVALGAAGAQLAVATWLQLALDRGFGRSDGNEGLQYVERQGLGPVEFFVGADGASAAVAWVLAAAAVLAATSGAGAPLALGGLAGLTLAALSQDLALAWLGLAAALGCLAALVGRARLGRAWAVPALGLALLAATTAALARSADGLLASGARPAWCFALPGILRSDHLGRALLGLPLAASAFALLLAAALPLALAWPLGGWLRATARRAEPGLAAGAVALGCGVPVVMLHTLVRVGALAVPEGVGWAGATLSWVGVSTALLGALAALGERGLGGRAWPLAAVQVGAALIGLGAGTPQGLIGSMAAAMALGAGLLLATGTEAGRAGWWTTRLGALTLAGAPGSLGFWGLALALLGSTPTRPAAALAALVAWAVALAAATRALRDEPAAEAPGATSGGDASAETSARLARIGLAGALVLAGLLPGGALGGLERWALDLGAFVSPPGPAQVAQK